MDSEVDISEVQSGNSNLRDFRFVEPVSFDLAKQEDGAKLQWLWDKVKSCDYAFDDFSRGSATSFIQGLGDPSCAHFLIDQSAYCVVRGLYEHSTPSIHFVVWEHDLGMPRIKAAGQEVIDWIFKTYSCHRIDAIVPSYNKLARRVATMLRFKFEGMKREAVRYNNRWHDVEIYGLLATQKTEVVQ